MKHVVFVWRGVESMVLGWFAKGSRGGVCIGRQQSVCVCNLDRALQLEFRCGDARPFELRKYATDFETLDEVNSSDDPTYRLEMLTPAQFHFGTSLGGIAFRPEMLSATLDETTGHRPAANDNPCAWRVAPFRFAGLEMAA